MDRIDIHRLAVSLQARVFSQLLAVCLNMSIPMGLDCTDVIMHNQEEITALDWIIATRRITQRQLPERCESRK